MLVPNESREKKNKGSCGLKSEIQLDQEIRWQVTSK